MGYLEVFFLGVGLATDASCVCTSNGLVYKPRLRTTLKMAIVYALFQLMMPIIGFLGASLLPEAIYQYNHIIACVLLCYIGGKMIFESIHECTDKEQDTLEERESAFTNKLLISQAIATSIDALSVGFAFSGMMLSEVVNASTMIAIVTFVMCFIFVKVGMYIGDKVNAKAELIGGGVLILIGINMLI